MFGNPKSQEKWIRKQFGNAMKDGPVLYINGVRTEYYGVYSGNGNDGMWTEFSDGRRSFRWYYDVRDMRITNSRIDITCDHGVAKILIED